MIVCDKAGKLDLTALSAVTSEDEDDIYEFVRTKACAEGERTVDDLYRRGDQENLARRIAQQDAAYLIERGAKPVKSRKTANKQGRAAVR